MAVTPIRNPFAQQRLLIVDDDRSLLRSFTRFFSRYFREVASAVNFDCAVEFVGDGMPIHVALVDLQLRQGRLDPYDNVTEGLDLITILKAAHSEAVMIVLSGWATTDVTVAAVKRGAADVINKPTEPDEILFRLARISMTSPMLPPVQVRFLTAARLQREYARRVLVACSGNVSLAARHLGLNRSTLKRQRRKWVPRI